MIGLGGGHEESKKTRFSLGLVVLANISLGKGSSIFCSPNWYSSAIEMVKGTVHKRMAVKKLFFVLFISILATPLHAQRDSTQHFTYISGDNKIGDLFYNSNNYYQCKTQRHCKVLESADIKPKRIALFIRDKESGLVIPSFIQCFRDGTSMVSMAENLVPLVNQALNNDPCLDVDSYEGRVPRRFLQDTIRTLDNLDDQGCPREDRSCARQIYEMFENDVKNLFRPFSSAPDPTMDMGCLSTIVANLLDALWGVAKLVAWELPRGIFQAGSNLWNYYFGQEQETSSAMLYASVMSEEMAEALSNHDFAKFYDELRKNFFAFIGAIREFYSELMGCNEWEGIPFDSECLRKTNWSCPTCESITNFVCGLTGQLGTGMALGAIMGVAKAGTALNRMKREISTDPRRFGLTEQAAESIGARQTLHQMRDLTQQARYQTGRALTPVTNFMNTALGEMKMLFALGNNFKTLVATIPITNPFHVSFQAGQRAGHRTFHRLSQDSNIPGLNLGATAHLGRTYGQAMANIQTSFADIIPELYRLRGNNFNPTIYNDISRRYISDVRRELERINIKATPIQGGRGLRLEKGGQVFEYRPNLRQKVREANPSLTQEEFGRFMTQMDPLNDIVTPTNLLPADTPTFLREVRERAISSRNTFVVQDNAADGFAYLAYFTSQSQSVPQNNRCENLLYNMELVGSYDITERVEEGGQDEPPSE